MFKFKVQCNSEFRRFSADLTDLAEITKRAQGLFGLSELPRLEVACPDGSFASLVDLVQLQSLSHLETIRLLCSPVSEAEKEEVMSAGATTLPNGKRVAVRSEKEEKQQSKRAALEALRVAQQEARAARELAVREYGDKLLNKLAAKAEARAQKLERQITLKGQKKQASKTAGASEQAQDAGAQDAGANTAPAVSKAECKALAKAERQALKAEKQAQKAERQAFKAEKQTLSGDNLIEEEQPSRQGACRKGELAAEKLALKEARLADKASRRAERDAKKAERAALKAVKDAAKAKLAAAWLTDVPANLAHLFVDGYNVAGSMPELRHVVRSNKTAVQAGVAAAAAMLLSPTAQGTVVFDGGNRHKMLQHASVHLRFSGKGTEADDVLVQLAAAQVATDSGVVVVVTSDRALALRLLEVGACVLKGSRFARLTAPDASDSDSDDDRDSESDSSSSESDQ